MLVGESVEGEKLVLEEGDLLVCTHSRVAHIVFLGTLCNTKMQHWGATVEGPRLWTKIGVCRNGQDYGQVIELLGYKVCRPCSQSLKRHGSKAEKSDAIGDRPN